MFCTWTIADLATTPQGQHPTTAGIVRAFWGFVHWTFTTRL
jgi:hypothetical protein